ncbi:MAG: hypothetical protein WCC26_17195 [Terracidiphilus sp.]
MDKTAIDARLPLPTLLSQALVAFTIEFDNEAEHRLPHRTSDYGLSAGAGFHAPWLVSMAMWSNCMRFVGQDGITVRNLHRRARTPTNLAGMLRWGYVTVSPGAVEGKAKAPQWAAVVRPTEGGRIAQRIWQPLFGEIEARWEQRFGQAPVDRLRSSLRDVAGQLDPALPCCMPILGYGLNHDDRLTNLSPPETAENEQRNLPELLAKVVVAFALDFERGSGLGLAIAANVLRVMYEKGVPVRDLPRRTGVSKESLKVALGFLGKRKLAAIERDPAGGPFMMARLTKTGAASQGICRALCASTEAQWQTRFGVEALEAVRGPLEELAGDGTPERSPLFRGLEPYPEGWRAKTRRPSTLPHFPMVLHRGGFPDGS